MPGCYADHEMRIAMAVAQVPVYLKMFSSASKVWLH